MRCPLGAADAPENLPLECKSRQENETQDPCNAFQKPPEQSSSLSRDYRNRSGFRPRYGRACISRFGRILGLRLGGYSLGG